ncbi:hypothetical protein DBIPINDM_007633 (plasmid) [Mesorhizobium sp. AR02]|uniref:hypothetical protein n=1 Tax=Mesorhizobium sp. AR02 TaxID=2865837 RepID=UPI00215F26CB|nr:hypothetical protein [Mesorhizobium sp. AR02]UVK49636.1 hypothetical protein DBIPINDM_007633 [Mesorhizobium sp. AR02]
MSYRFAHFEPFASLAQVALNTSTTLRLHAGSEIDLGGIAIKAHGIALLAPCL